MLHAGWFSYLMTDDNDVDDIFSSELYCYSSLLFFSHRASAPRNWGPPPGELNTDGRDMLIYGILSSD